MKNISDLSLNNIIKDFNDIKDTDNFSRLSNIINWGIFNVLETSFKDKIEYECRKLRYDIHNNFVKLNNYSKLKLVKQDLWRKFILW